MSHVRTTIIYGAEMLSKEARKPFVDIDKKVTNLLLSKLLKFGRNTLVRKHQLRIKIAMGVPTREMYIDKIIHSRITSWLEKRTSSVTQVADRASDSLKYITNLDNDHPLRVSMRQYRPHSDGKAVAKL